MRKIIITASLLFVYTLSFAQSKYIYGKLIDSITLLPVQNVNVMNLNTGETDVTNNRGLFMLQGKFEDTLMFAKIGYENKRMVLAGNAVARGDTLRIILIPKIKELQSVTVSAYSYADYQQDSAARRRDFAQTVGFPRRWVESSNSGAGIGFSLDRLFSRKEKNRNNAYRFFQQNEEQEYINFRFNPILIHGYTGLRGDSLQLFINRYQPSYKWLRAHERSDDIFYYINDKLKDFYSEK
jgi:hypothetical protein